MIYNNYIHTKKLDLNTEVLKESSRQLFHYIKENFVADFDSKYKNSPQETMVTNLYTKYNLFLYPLEGFHDLFSEICKYFYEINPSCDEKYYMQSWLNVYQEGQSIDWHSHWEPKFETYHGFYCVNIPEKTYTLYKLNNSEDIIEVPSENNLLVISKSDGDSHKSTSGSTDENPRITIAFDIIPGKYLDPLAVQNHWVPI